MANINVTHPSTFRSYTTISSPLDTSDVHRNNEEGMDETVGDTSSINTVSPILFGAMCSLAFCGLILVGTFLIFNLTYRKHRLVKMSSPNLNILILLGAAFMYGCVVIFGMDSAVVSLHGLSVLSRIRVCVLPISFTLIYGTIFTKSWRVYRIFSPGKGAKRTVIRDPRLVAILTAMLTVDCIIVILWLSLDAPRCDIISRQDALFTVTAHDSSSVGSSHNTIACSSKYQGIWLLLMCVYKAAILVSVTYIAWATRNVMVVSMNDAKCIIVSVYTCAMMTSLVCAMSPLLWRWPNVWYACVAVVILICTTEVLLLHYVPKMREWKSNPDGDLARNLSASYLATKHPASFIQVEEELFILSAENAKLKLSLTEKDDTIRMLQGHVSSATEKLRQLALDTNNKDSGCDLDELEESSASGQSDPEAEGEQIDPVKPQRIPTLTDIRAHHELKTNDVTEQRPPPQKTVCRHTKSTGNIQRVQRSRRSKDHRNSFKRLSVSSDTSFKQFEELKDSIAMELYQVHNISSDLRDAIAQDLDYCRPRPMYFDIADSEREITEVLNETYNLPEESYEDSESTMSSAFTYDNPVFPRNNRGRHGSGGSKCSVFTTKTSRQSSFRSVASMTPDLGRRPRNRNGRLCKHSSLKMHWPLYRPPAATSRDAKPRDHDDEAVPEAGANTTTDRPKISTQTSDSNVLYGTYV